MTLKQPELAEDDPRRALYTQTTYRASRGGHYPTPEPPKREDRGNGRPAL
jgi:hypothetical protein